ECGTVRGFLALLVRRTESNNGLCADQGRLARLRGGRFDRRLDRLRIMPVYSADHVPAIGFETRWRVVGEPAFDFAINRDSVVVPHRDEFAQTQRSGQRGDLVRNAFHQETIAVENKGVVIGDIEYV